jgi:hypothetical protein
MVSIHTTFRSHRDDRDDRDGTIRCRHRVPEIMGVARQEEGKSNFRKGESGPQKLRQPRVTKFRHLFSFLYLVPSACVFKQDPSLNLVPAPNPLSTFHSVSTQLLLSRPVLFANLTYHFPTPARPILGHVSVHQC